MYGLYDSRKDGQEAINSLPRGLKGNSPTVEGVGRKQKLYKMN